MTEKQERQKAADRLKRMQPEDLEEHFFRYPAVAETDSTGPEGEPSDAETLWWERAGSPPRRLYDQLQGGLITTTLANFGLLTMCVLLFVPANRREPTTPACGIILASAIIILGLTILAFVKYRRRIIKTVFDDKIANAFEMARTAPEPWLMVRWLGRAFVGLKTNPLLIQKLYVLDPAEDPDGRPNKNSLAWSYRQLADAAALAIDTFPARGSRQDNKTAADNFDALVRSIEEEQLGRFKYRYTLAAHCLALANLLIAWAAVIVGGMAVGFLLHRLL